MPSKQEEIRHEKNSYRASTFIVSEYVIRRGDFG
jgi:hypothetical protein